VRQVPSLVHGAPPTAKATFAAASCNLPELAMASIVFVYGRAVHPEHVGWRASANVRDPMPAAFASSTSSTRRRPPWAIPTTTVVNIVAVIANSTVVKPARSLASLRHKLRGKLITEAKNFTRIPHARSLTGQIPCQPSGLWHATGGGDSQKSTENSAELGFQDRFDRGNAVIRLSPLHEGLLLGKAALAKRAMAWPRTRYQPAPPCS
jgi:hypothetical protein